MTKGPRNKIWREAELKFYKIMSLMGLSTWMRKQKFK